MCDFKHLCEEFKRLEGQPVRIIMNDIHVFCGTVISAYDSYCRIIDRCGDVILVEYCHIDAVEEPKMRLQRFPHKCYECGFADEDEDCKGRDLNIR